MLWAYYIPHELNDYWVTVYVFNREQKRDINSPSYDLDITYYDSIRIRAEPSKRLVIVEQGIKDKGYYIDRDLYEIFVPDRFDRDKLLAWVKVLIQELFDDDDPVLSEGEEYEFTGTNQDSLNVMQAKANLKAWESDHGS